MTLAAFIAGIGVLGPGLGDWPETAAVLSGRQSYRPAATVLPMPTLLAAAERRRTGRVVKLALAIGLEATAHAGMDPAHLASVFSSSGGDGPNCHELCQALATAAVILLKHFKLRKYLHLPKTSARYLRWAHVILLKHFRLRKYLYLPKTSARHLRWAHVIYLGFSE